MPVAVMRGGVVDGATSGATQDFTIAGFTAAFGQPKAALFIVTARASSAGSTSPKNLGLGFTDGTNHRGISALSRDAQANSDTRSQAYDNTVLRFLLADGSGDDAICTFNSWITDGIRLNLSRAFDAAVRIQFILFGGADLSAIVGTITPNSTAGADVAVSCGFEPDALFCISDNGAFNETLDTGGLLNCFSLAINDQPGATVRSMSMRHTDNQANASPTMVFGDADLGHFHTGENTPLTILAGTAFSGSDPWTATGFNVKSLAHASGTTGPVLGFLALKFGGVPFSLDTYATPTATGNQAYTAPGFRVTSAIGFLSTITGTWGSLNEQSGSAAGAMGFCFLDEVQDASLTLYDEDNAATMNTSSRYDDEPLKIRDHTDATDQYVATVQSRDENGITFNFTTAPGTAMKFVLLTLGALVQFPVGLVDGAGSMTIEGTAAVTGPGAGTLAASGSETIGGTGAPAGASPPGALDGAGTETITGEGAPSGPSPAASGAGTETITGAGGSPTGPSPSAAGVGSETITGTGAGTFPHGAVAGAGPLPPKRRVTKHTLEVAGTSTAVPKRRATKHALEVAALERVAPVTPLALPAVLANQLLANWRGGAVTVATSWRTAIFSGFEPCAEERVGQWGRPARTMKVRFTGIGAEGDRPVSSRLLMNVLRHAQGRQPVPIYPDVSPLLGTASGTTIPCDTRWKRFAPGARVLVHKWTQGQTHPGPYELAEVEEVLPDRLITKAALGASYAKGAAFPVMDAELVAKSSGRFPGSQVGEFQLTFAEVPGPSALPSSCQAWPAMLGGPYLGHPVWMPPHNFADGMTLEVVREGNASEGGRASMFAPSGAVPRLVHGIDIRATSRERWWDFLRVFDGRQGMRKPLWLVPPEHVFGFVDVTGAHLHVDAVGNLADCQAFVRGVAVVMRDGSHWVRKVNSWTLIGDTFRAVLESAPPAFDQSKVAYVTVAHLVRFDSDELTEEWDTADDCSGSAKLIDLLEEEAVEVEHVQVFGPPKGPAGVAKSPPPVNVDGAYLWVESTKGLYTGEASGEPTKPVAPCQSDAWFPPQVDFWFDVRVQAPLLLAENEPFPPPFLKAKWFGPSFDGHKNPFLVNFKKWKVNKGRDIVEMCGTDAPYFVLQQETPTEKFWSDADGMTVFLVARFRESEEHWIIDRPGVFRWRHDRVEFYEDLGVVSAPLWFNHANLRTKQLRLVVLRWIPGADVRLWRAGKLLNSKTSNVATHLAGDDPGAETKVLQLEASISGPGNAVQHIGLNSFVDAFVIFKSALPNSEINLVAKHFVQLYKVKWKNLP